MYKRQTWGSNVPLTRTPDAHFLTEVRYKGTKVVSVSPDYAESTTSSDAWLNVKAGTDAALAMAMGHVKMCIRDRKQRAQHICVHPCQIVMKYFYKQWRVQ